MQKLRIMIANWKTTLMSILPILGSVAIALGYIDLEKQTAIVNGVEIVLDSADSILNAIMSVTLAVTGVGLLFAKDGDKSSKSLGI